MRTSWWHRPALAVVWVCLAVSTASAQVPAGSLRGMLGANAPQLVLQYTGTASSANGSPAARAVTVAMARKAIADARDVGFSFLRVMAAGYGPVAPPPAGAPGQDDLALWQADPERYWSCLDRMFDDLDAANIRLVPSFLWNPLQFPALTNETIADLIANPHSASRRLLLRYMTEFIERYRARHTILFYELTNELNLEADLDLVGRCLATAPAANCAAYGNFTTAQMNLFARELTQRIRTLDPTRAISSGYSLPRAAAFHLAAQPEFSANGPDWTQDSKAQFRYMLIVTGKPFDLWSVHIYPGDVRWGDPAGSEAITLAVAAHAALYHGKRLYLGEFGDTGVSPYLVTMLHRLGVGTVAYASIWVWELYQQSTWQSADLTASPPMSLEPGFTDAIDELLTHAADGLGRWKRPSVRVVITAPLPCATLSGAVQLYATASASGLRQVDRVQFAVDGVPVGVAGGAPFHVGYAPTVAGWHQVSATAYAGDVSATTATPVLIGATDMACRVP